LKGAYFANKILEIANTVVKAMNKMLEKVGKVYIEELW